MANPASAEPLLRRALRMFGEAPVGRSRYAATLVSLGIVYEQEGKRALAEDALTQSLRGDSPADSRSTIALELLAVLLAREKRCQEAAEFANHADRIIRSTFGQDGPPRASALATVAFVEEHAGDLENAEHHYSQALRILRAYKLLDSSAGFDVMTQYVIVLRKLHRGQEAKSVNAELARFRSAAQLPH
jgi:tetratricopeptide (TPR) repeat protein